MSGLPIGALQPVALWAQLPGHQIGFLAILRGVVVGHVDGFADRARDERLRRRHHADVALHREIALADLAAGIDAVEHVVVLGLRCGAPSTVIAPQMCTLAASISRLENPTAASRSKFGAAIASGAIFSVSRRKSSPKVHLLKANLMSNAVGSAASTFFRASSVKPFAFKVETLMAGALLSGPWPTA